MPVPPPPNCEPVPVEGLGRGMDNRTPETRLGLTGTRVADNVDIDQTGRVRRRHGWRKLLDATNAHSLWSHPRVDFALFVANGQLTRMKSSLETQVIALVDPGLSMNYAELNEEVYFSNGQQNGVIGQMGGRSWGLPIPPPPGLMAVDGNLEAGTYQVVYTWVREKADGTPGEESGAPQGSLITLTAGQSIAIPYLAPHPEARWIRIYRTPPDGGTFYLAAQLDVDVGGMTLAGGQLGRQLETQFLEPMPAGRQIRQYAGRLWVTTGNTVYYTEAMRPGYTRREHNYFQVPGEIILLQPVTGGLFIATSERTWFLAGRDPADMGLAIVDDKGALPDTGTSVPAHVFRTEENITQGRIAFWWDTDGVAIIGRADGLVQRLTLNKLIIPKYRRGSTSYRAVNGMQQILTLFENSSPSGIRLAAPGSVEDSPVADVYRYGIDLSSQVVTIRDGILASSGCGESAACNDDISDTVSAFTVGIDSVS